MRSRSAWPWWSCRILLPALARNRLGPGGASDRGIVIGIDRTGTLPDVAPARFDVLLTTAANALRPWVVVSPDALEVLLAALRTRIATYPAATAVFARVLRITESLSFADALHIESLAYSVLLGGSEFRAWRRSRPQRAPIESGRPRVALFRSGDEVTVRLTRPERRNAFDARMRDELVDALQFTLDDVSVSRVLLEGEGPAFSAGGDLDEFGTATDLAQAHVIRTTRSPALLVHCQRAKVHAHLQGACVGAGIEIPAAAGHVDATGDAWFRLPEIGMGLIPGAGGTASIPRRIGRHRTFWWGLQDLRLDARVALEWGLVDAIVPAARP